MMVLVCMTKQLWIGMFGDGVYVGVRMNIVLSYGPVRSFPFSLPLVVFVLVVIFDSSFQFESLLGFDLFYLFVSSLDRIICP